MYSPYKTFGWKAARKGRLGRAGLSRMVQALPNRILI